MGKPKTEQEVMARINDTDPPLKSWTALVYVACWMSIPEKEDAPPKKRMKTSSSSSGRKDEARPAVSVGCRKRKQEKDGERAKKRMKTSPGRGGDNDEAPAANFVVGNPSSKKRPRVRVIRKPAAGPHPDQPSGPSSTPEMPESLRKKIMDMGGESVTFVIEKKLFGTDISSQHNRLSMPMNKIRQDFVTEEERQRLESRNGNANGIDVILVEPSLREEEVTLKRWKMKETSIIYVLIKNWHLVAWRNGLQVGDLVRVWTFRVQSKLCFAIVKAEEDENEKTADGKKDDGAGPSRRKGKEVVVYDDGGSTSGAAANEVGVI